MRTRDTLSARHRRYRHALLYTSGISDTPTSQLFGASRQTATTKKEQLAVRRAQLQGADDMAHKGVQLPRGYFFDRFFPLPSGLQPPVPAKNPFSRLKKYEKAVTERFVSGLESFVSSSFPYAIAADGGSEQQ